MTDSNRETQIKLMDMVETLDDLFFNFVNGGLEHSKARSQEGYDYAEHALGQQIVHLRAHLIKSGMVTKEDNIQAWLRNVNRLCAGKRDYVRFDED